MKYFKKMSAYNVYEIPDDLKNRLSDMIETYQWEFNTPEIRNEIKSKADTICERYKTNNEIYDFHIDTWANCHRNGVDTYIEVEKDKGITKLSFNF